MSNDNGFLGLRRLHHRVQSVDFGEQTGFRNGHLTVSAKQLEDLIASPVLDLVHFNWVRPGESKRIVKILDTVQPRTKGPGGGGIFPGLIGPAIPQGRGETHILDNVAVCIAGYLPRAQQGLAQMSGPTSELTFLGQTNNLVVDFKPVKDADWVQVEKALRLGLLRIATALAEATLDSTPEATEEFPSLAISAGGNLPKVGAIVNIQTQGAFKDVFVYGRSMASSMPSAIDPNELDDGAVVSGQYGHPGLKNPTWMHQNNPVVAALRERDGKDLQFAGVILAPEPVEQALKETVSAHAARLAYQMGLDAVIVTKEGGGNADSDISLKIDACEEMGIAGIGIFPEMSGADGTGPPLVGPPSKANALVSTGNYDEQVTLEEVAETFGGEIFDLLGVESTIEMEIPTAIIYGSLSPLGWGRLTCAEATP